MYDGGGSRYGDTPPGRASFRMVGPGAISVFPPTADIGAPRPLPEELSGDVYVSVPCEGGYCVTEPVLDVSCENGLVEELVFPS